MERFDTLVKRAGEIYARATADSAAAAVGEDADGQRDVIKGQWPYRPAAMG